jgi:predicted nucleic acid-binding protein
MGITLDRPWWTRAVLDTTVLMSAHRHWLWLLARRGYFVSVWSAFIVGELVRVRTELSIKNGVERAVYGQRINDLIHLFSDVMLIIDYRRVSTGTTLKDPDDEPILAAAIAADAGCIVSLNTRDFPPGGEVADVRFVTPQELLEALTTAYPEADIPAQAEAAGKQVP